MIGKQLKNKSFRGTLDYVLGKQQSRLIGGNMAGSSPQGLTAEFELSRCLRPSLERVCFHGILSLPHRDRTHPEGELHEALSDYQWAVIADDYLQKMGFENCQHVLVRHHDTEHEHLHIVASRITLDGEVVSDSWDYYRSEAVIRKLEREFNLEPVTPSWESMRRGQTQFEVHNDREGRRQLQQNIDAVVADCPSMTEFITRLQERETEVRLKVGFQDQIQGISYGLGNESFSGTKLGKGYSWTGLQSYLGVSYEQKQDQQLLAIAGRAAGGGTRTTGATDSNVAGAASESSSGGYDSASGGSGTGAGTRAASYDRRADWERLLEFSESLVRDSSEPHAFPATTKPADPRAAAADFRDDEFTGGKEHKSISRFDSNRPGDRQSDTTLGGDSYSDPAAANRAARDSQGSPEPSVRPGQVQGEKTVRVSNERSAKGYRESVEYGAGAKSNPRTDAPPEPRAGESLGLDPGADGPDEGVFRKPEESHLRHPPGQSEKAQRGSVANRRNATDNSRSILSDKTTGATDHGPARNEQSPKGEISVPRKGDQEIYSNADQPQGDTLSEWGDGVGGSQRSTDNLGSAIYSPQDSAQRKDGTLRDFQADRLDLPQHGGAVSGSPQDARANQKIDSQSKEAGPQPSQRQELRNIYTMFAARVIEAETNYEELVKLAEDDHFKGRRLDKGVAIQALRHNSNPKMAAKILGQSPYVQHQLHKLRQPRAQVIRYVEAILNEANQEIQSGVVEQPQRWSKTGLWPSQQIGLSPSTPDELQR